MSIYSILRLSRAKVVEVVVLVALEAQTLVQVLPPPPLQLLPVVVVPPGILETWISFEIMPSSSSFARSSSSNRRCSSPFSSSWVPETPSSPN